MTDTDIVARQRADHARMDELIERYEQGDVAAKCEVFRGLVTLVTTHAFAEETVLFPAARKVLRERGEELTRTLEEEHQQVNELLAELDGHHAEDERVATSVPRLFAILRDDARREEDALLVDLAAAAPEQLESLGRAWEASRRVAPNRAHPAVPRRPPDDALVAPFFTIVDRLRSMRARILGRAQ